MRILAIGSCRDWSKVSRPNTRSICGSPFRRAANVLSAAATFLPKTDQITGAQASSLLSTASTLDSAASTIWTNLLANLYIAPSGPTPGHFAQGATGNTLDTSQALDASGHWAALCAHANGRDDIALAVRGVCL